MNRRELRHRLISVLLQAAGPLALGELADQCGGETKDVLPVLKELLAEGRVVEGLLLPDRPGPQYRWAARWEEQAKELAAGSRKKLTQIVDAQPAAPPGKLDVDSQAVLAFHRYVVEQYRPPRDKRFLVFLQCSVRRPFSTSPSHASMRRAVQAATGCDPSKDFETCPVHVVVLASKIGPVPYELEDVYPANVGGGGVKHFRPEYYARVKPVLASRMAEYITAHGRSYDRIASFTEGRYGEVMAEAGRIAGVRFPVFPDKAGARIVQMAGSRPRTYWAKYWIQLHQEIVRWLDPPMRAQAAARLKEMDVTYR